MRRRVGRRVLDAEDAEIRAETQLTRRYWRFLDGVPGAVLLLGASKVEAATLAVRDMFQIFLTIKGFYSDDLESLIALSSLTSSAASHPLSS